MENYLMKRIKTLANGNTPGKVIGMIIATKRGLGYSVANDNHGDKYDEQKAYEICYNRIDTDTVKKFEQRYYNQLRQKNMNMAKYIYNELVMMEQRASRYFKEEKNV